MVMKIRILAILLLFPMLVRSQIISGYVKDSVNNSPIVGVNVYIGNKGAVTDLNGYFKLSNIPFGEQIISFSSLGFKKINRHIKINPDEGIQLEIMMSKEEFYIDEVIVSASRSDNRLSEIPGRINMISPERISSLAYQTIDEQLQFIPGVNVSRSFGIFSTKSSVTMRGLSGNEQARTLVLLDGVPVNKADGGSVNWNLISTNQLEQLEVMKGPGSALYGGNAMGGIINVLTSKPTKKVQGNLIAEYGTYNTQIYRLNLAGKFGDEQSSGFYWSANTFYQKSDGYITQSEADQKANPFIIKSTVDEKALNTSFGYTKTEKLDASVSFSFYDGLRGTGEKVYQPEGNTTDYKTYLFRSNFKGKVGVFKWNASLFYIDEHYIKVNEFQKDDYTWYDVLSIRRDYGLLSVLNYQKGKHSFTAGIDIRNGSVDAYDMYYTSTDKVDNKGKIDFYGFYIQDDISLSSKIKLLAGLRYDISRFYDGAFIIHHPSAETEFLMEYQFQDKEDVKWGAFSPRVSIQYMPKSGFRIYASYSRGFRPSVLDDLCRTGRVRGGMKVANPDLKPEYLDNIEFGSDYTLSKNLKVAASLYYSKGKDFLYYVSTGDSIDMGFGLRPIMIRENISNVEIYGAELEINYNPLPFLTSFVNYAYCSSTITEYTPLSAEDPVNLQGKYLTDVPMHSFSAGILLNSKIVNAGLSCRYTGAMYVNDQNVYDEIVLSDQYPPAFTLDMRLSREFFKYLILGLKVQNIFDEQIYDSKGSVGPGRFITISLGIKI